MEYYCGIDLGNKSLDLCVIDESRKVVFSQSVGTRADLVKKAFEAFTGRLICVVEAGALAEWLVDVLEPLGHEVSIVCPRKAKIALQSNGGKKTDSLDARALAEYCRTSWFTPVHKKSAEARELRSVMKARTQICECSRKLACSIRGLLRANGVTESLPGSDDPEFSSEVKRLSMQLSPALRRTISSMLCAFKDLRTRHKKMYAQLNKLSKKSPEMKRMQQVEGVGPAVAASFYSAIDNPDRFKSGEQVSSYLGLVPSVHQSGETLYHGRITKQGDGYTRWLLVEAAHIILSRSKADTPLRRWGLQLQQKKGAGKARVAVARKLAGILWRIWRDDIDYQPELTAA